MRGIKHWQGAEVAALAAAWLILVMASYASVRRQLALSIANARPSSGLVLHFFDVEMYPSDAELWMFLATLLIPPLTLLLFWLHGRRRQSEHIAPLPNDR